MDGPAQVISSLALFAVILAFCVLVIRNGKDWSKPLSLIMVWAVIFIACDGFYTLIQGDYGPREYGRLTTPVDQLSAAGIAWLAALVGIASGFGLTMLLAGEREAPTAPLADLAKSRRVETIALAIAGLITLAALFTMVGRAASVGLAFNQIAGQRNRALADGGGPLYTLIVAYKATVMVVLFRRATYDPRVFRHMSVHLLLACLIDLAVGTRSGVVFNIVIPAAIGLHHLRHRISPIRMAGPIATLLILLVPIYRTLTRDVGFERNRGIGAQDLVVRNLSTLPRMLFGGNEISALDGTVDIVKTYGNGIPFLDGKTVIESPLALVPRSIYGEDKPYGGASTIYTQRLYASNYGKERSELLSSAVGEAYMNYSLLGVLPFFIAIGSLVAGAYHLAFRNNVPRSPELLLFYSLFMARFLAYLRGDLFGFVGQSFNILLVTFLVNWAIKAASRGIEARRRQTI